MPDLDSAAKAAVGSAGFAPAWFIFLDIDGDPLRVTTYDIDTTFASTGDPDLDGKTFVAFGGSLIDVGDVSNSDTGSDSLTITLSGIVSIDTTLLDDIADKSKWQGRLCRLWFQLYDPLGATPQGAIVSYYTGYMSSVPMTAAPKTQTIQLSSENYLAYTTQASNRSYMNQSDYDPADTSAAATLSAANGLQSGGTGATSGGGGGGPGTGDGGSRFQLSGPIP